MRLRIDVRIDPKADRRALARACRDRGSRCSSSLADSTLKQRMPSSSARCISASVFPTPENTILRRIGAGRDRARQLAAGDDVEAAAQAREQVQDRQVRVGLHRVADQVRHVGEGAIELAEGVLERCARVDEARRAVARGDVPRAKRLRRRARRRDSRTRSRLLVAGAIGCGRRRCQAAGRRSGTIARRRAVRRLRRGSRRRRRCRAAAAFAGGSFSGPLMPQEIEREARRVHAMIEAMKRRNIPGCVDAQYVDALNAVSNAIGGQSITRRREPIAR